VLNFFRFIAGSLLLSCPDFSPRSQAPTEFTQSVGDGRRDQLALYQDRQRSPLSCEFFDKEPNLAWLVDYGAINARL